MKKNSAKYFLTLLMVMVFGFMARGAMAQCEIEAAPNEGGSCQSYGYPLCYHCVEGENENECVPNADFCNDNNDCTTEECAEVVVDPYPTNYLTGCIKQQQALLHGDDILPFICYDCDKCGNGVCERNQGENCSTCPEDCDDLSGLECIYPNSPTPPYEDDVAQIPEDRVCFAQNDTGPFETLSCADGDLCTIDLCDAEIIAKIKYQQQQPEVGVCQNIEKECNPAPDGCCPAGCVGPLAGETCGAAAPIPGCDPDCWPPQVCGDGFLQQPDETCDGSIPGDKAGTKPDGSNITDAECRVPGSVGECTACGDGIIQAEAGEQCDGLNDDACGAAGCNSDCQCNADNFCLTGSGVLFDDISPVCVGCSLNKSADLSNSSIAGMAAILGALFMGLMARQRIANKK